MSDYSLELELDGCEREIARLQQIIAEQLEQIWGLREESERLRADKAALAAQLIKMGSDPS